MFNFVFPPNTFRFLRFFYLERNYGGISPIVHPGRFSHPDLRYWDAGVPFFSEATPFSSVGLGYESVEVFSFLKLHNLKKQEYDVCLILCSSPFSLSNKEVDLKISHNIVKPRKSS